MSRLRLSLLNIVLVCLMLALSLGPAAAAGEETLVRIALVDEHDAAQALAAAPVQVLALLSTPQPFAVARVDEIGVAWLVAQGYRYDVLDAEAAGMRYVLVDLTGALANDPRAGEVIYRDRDQAILRLPADDVVEFDHGMTPLDQAMTFQPRLAARLPQVITPIAQVQQIINQITSARLMAYANELSGETPALINGQPYTIATRYTYSGVPLQRAEAYVIERVQRLGLNVTTHTWNASYPPNIIAEKPGLDPNSGIMIIGAHLDSTSGSAATLAPGADDNGSGSVAVLLAAELLAPYNFNATIRFVWFTGEEQGLYGSTAYANSVAAQDIRGMLNMDMIAWDSQGGPDMDIHARSTVPGSMELGTLYSDVVTAYTLPLTPAVYSNGSTASDHSPFWNINVPAIMAIENYRSDTGIPADFNAYYHSTNDRTLSYNMIFFRAMAKASTATFAHMAGLRTNCYWADLDCSGAVDVVDLSKAASAWQASSGQWNYSLAYDPDASGAVDVVDIQRFAAEWGWAGK